MTLTKVLSAEAQKALSTLKRFEESKRKVASKLSLMEEARLIGLLVEPSGDSTSGLMTKTELAAEIGVSRATLHLKLQLLRLIPELQLLVDSEKIGFKVAVKLSEKDILEQRAYLAERCLDE